MKLHTNIVYGDPIVPLESSISFGVYRVGIYNLRYIVLNRMANIGEEVCLELIRDKRLSATRNDLRVL